MSQEIINVHNLSNVVNEHFGEVVSQVLNSETIALNGGNIIVLRISPDKKTCALESWSMNSGGFFVKSMLTMAQAKRSDAIDFICQRVSVTAI